MPAEIRYGTLENYDPQTPLFTEDMLRRRARWEDFNYGIWSQAIHGAIQNQLLGQRLGMQQRFLDQRENFRAGLANWGANQRALLNEQAHNSSLSNWYMKNAPAAAMDENSLMPQPGQPPLPPTPAGGFNFGGFPQPGGAGTDLPQFADPGFQQQSVPVPEDFQMPELSSVPAPDTMAGGDRPLMPMPGMDAGGMDVPDMGGPVPAGPGLQLPQMNGLPQFNVGPQSPLDLPSMQVPDNPPGAIVHPSLVATAQQQLAGNQQMLEMPQQQETAKLQAAINRGDPRAIQEGIRRGLLYFTDSQKQEIRNIQQAMHKLDSDPRLTPSDRVRAQTMLGQKLFAIRPTQRRIDEQPVDFGTQVQQRIATVINPFSGKPERMVVNRNGEPRELITESEKEAIKLKNQKELEQWRKDNGIGAEGKAEQGRQSIRDFVRNDPREFHRMYDTVRKSLRRTDENGNVIEPSEADIEAEMDRIMKMHERLRIGNFGQQQPAAPNPFHISPPTMAPQHPLGLPGNPYPAYPAGVDPSQIGGGAGRLNQQAQPPQATQPVGAPPAQPKPGISLQEAQSLPHPRSKAERDALPPGTRYVTPDGQIGTRP